MQITCSSLTQRKRIVILLVFAIILSFLLLLSSFAFASDDVVGYLSEQYMSLFSKNMLEEAADIMLGRTNGFYESSNALGSSIMPIFKGIGGAIILINTTVMGFREFTKESFNVNTFLKIVLKFVISLTVIFMVNDILSAIETAGYSIATGLYDSITGVVTYEPEIIDAEGTIDHEFAYGVWMDLTVLVSCVLPCLIIEVLNTFVKIVSYGIFFELVMRRALMPIALANTFTDGPRSPGMLFLKRYLALYLRIGLVFIVLGCAYSFINASMNVNTVNWNDMSMLSIIHPGIMFPMIFDAVCVMIASCVFITKGSNFIEEVFAIR